MKVGDRIMVFQITDVGEKTFPRICNGLQRPICTEDPDEMILFTRDVISLNSRFFKNELKHVCTMVIKSIKQ